MGTVTKEAGLSDGFCHILRPNLHRVSVTGASVGERLFFKVEHDPINLKFRVRLYSEYNDAEGSYLAESDTLDDSTLPATVTLNEAASSGYSATIIIESVNYP